MFFNFKLLGGAMSENSNKKLFLSYCGRNKKKKSP